MDEVETLERWRKKKKGKRLDGPIEKQAIKGTNRRSLEILLIVAAIYIRYAIILFSRFVCNNL